jgi:hypothetical protein
MTDDLVASLARAQANMPPIPKNHENKHFGSRYADIADVLAVVRPVLAAEGIALVQATRITEQGTELVTALLKGMERLESVLPLQMDQKAQDLGSRLTYLRRYALCALVGVAAEDDDDGNAASTAPPRTRVPRDKPAAQWNEDNGATEPQQKAIAAKLGALGASKKDEKVALLKHLTGFESTKDLSKQQASDVLDTLKPFEDGAEWGMFVYSNAGVVSIVEVGEEPFDVKP